MARSGDVSRIVCANTVPENERRLLEARMKSQVLRCESKGRNRQDWGKLFHKLNQAVKGDTAKSAEKSNLSGYNRNVTSCWYGPVLGFPSGVWWGIRMDCSRDGVHSPFDDDVDEGPFGVTSICTSHTNMKEDVDQGDFLTLTGQIYLAEQPNVDPFIRNYENQIPLRLVRSYNLQNDIAPNTGYRYDGLYIVTSYWIGVSMDGIKYNKFALMRLIDQEPPSWNSVTLESLSFTRHCVSSTKSKPCGSSSVYDLRKCSSNAACGKRKFSHGDNHEAPLTTMRAMPLISTKKSVPESSIVTRYVFKKPNNADNTTCSSSVPDRKTLMCLGTSAPRTHNTNISIRMGLYESSHNALEVKKSISTMLHKPFKPIDTVNRTALTSREDNKLVARIDAEKSPPNPQSNESASCNGYITVNDSTANELTNPLNKRRKNLCSHIVHPSHSCDVSPLLNDSNIDSIECEERPQDARHSANESTNPDNSSQKSSPKYQNILETSYESFYAQTMRSLKSLESLTPDKILNLINKEKHHPLSKLLIDNVIGLTNEECTMWNASKVTASDVPPKINHKQRDNIKENVACFSEHMMNRRYYKYSKSKRLSWAVTKQTDAAKFDKILPHQSHGETDENCNGNVRTKDRSGISKENNEYLSSYHVKTSLQTIAQHTRSAYDIKTRLRADKAVVLAKQEFASSPIKKNKYKKQDREIANLSIDANIGPKTRGPRNRRLRCINSTYANKRYYGTFNPVVYPPGKRNRITEKQRYKAASFKQKSKLTKVSHQRTRDRSNKDRYRVSSTLRTKSDSKNVGTPIEREKNFEGIANNNNHDDCNYNSNNEKTRKRESRTDVTSDAENCNVSKTTFNKDLRNKLAVQAVPLSHRIPQTSRLYYFRNKQIEKPNTMDATTQCRLIYEEPVISENSRFALFGQSVDQRVTNTVERTISEKTKISRSLRYTSTCNERGSQIYQTSRLNLSTAFTETNERYVDSSRSLRTRSFTAEKSIKDRTSAFVPVNMLDSDLRIARLRSIGFKPIIEPRSQLVMGGRTIQSDKKNMLASVSKVMRRDVAEEYDKYTNNEDNSVVVYMDDKLQYQDIEEEDESILARERTSLTKVSTKPMMRNVQSSDDTVLPHTLTLHENLESPWHGWKKVVTNNQSYWVGW